MTEHKVMSRLVLMLVKMNIAVYLQQGGSTAMPGQGFFPVISHAIYFFYCLKKRKIPYAR